jgi:hypothetical protein
LADFRPQTNKNNDMLRHAHPCPFLLCLVPALCAHLHAHAAPDDEAAAPVSQVLVEGARTSQLGVADSANAGTITQKELELRTIYRPGELLEAAPGVIVSQHSGEGKANQFFLRGFNLDHGTDLATFVDDMPVNQRSHAHGQGWTDLNFLVPELAARLDYRKGPYSARDGDFASAGTAAVTYVNRLARPVATAGIGQDGYARTLVAGTRDLGAAQGGALTYALELLHNDGPFTHPEGYRKVNGVLRYTQGPANNGWSVTAMAYHGSWTSTDQIPARAVADGSLGRFDAVDPSDGGNARRLSLSGTWRRTEGESASKLSAYVIRNDLALWSNFTYYLDDPVNGDQVGQPDHRVTTGLSALHAWHALRGDGNGIDSDFTFGLQAQNDNVVNGLDHTAARRLLATWRRDHLVETSGALWIENATHWTRWLRTVAGLRADAYRFRVASNVAVNSGSAADRLASPSLAVVLGPWRSTELYLNAGQGFHSNDARGTVATVDVRTGDALDRTPGLVRSRGLELGARTEWFPKMQTAVSLYRLDFDSELRFIGDSGTTEAGPPSRRIGIEFSNYWKPAPWLSVDVDAAFAHARSRNAPAGEDRIPDAVEGVGQLALTVSRFGPWEGGLQVRWFGPRPLIEDDSVRSHASTTLSGRLGYRLYRGLHRDLRLELEAFNLTNKRSSSIEYWYPSRLRGESAARDDIHFHPIEARSLRLTLVANW